MPENLLLEKALHKNFKNMKSKPTMLRKQIKLA